MLTMCRNVSFLPFGSAPSVNASSFAWQVDRAAAADWEMTTIEEDDKGATTSALATLDERRVRMDATMCRAAMSKELEELNQVLQAKEELANKMVLNDSHLELIKNQYKVRLTSSRVRSCGGAVCHPFGVLFQSWPVIAIAGGKSI